MRLTRAQIERMALAAKASSGDLFYIEEQKDGKISFGEVEVIEKKKSIALGKVGLPKEAVEEFNKAVATP